MNIEVEATQDENKSITQLWHQICLANSYAPKEKPDFVLRVFLQKIEFKYLQDYIAYS